MLHADEVRRVRAVLYLNGLRGPDIDDAVQEVHLRVLEHAPGDLRAQGAWACTVATRLAIDWHRRASTHRRLVSRLSALGERVEAPAVDLPLVTTVRRALRRLDPDVRATVVLRYYADLSVTQVAAALGVPEGTVKSRLHRAAALLRHDLEGEVS